MNDSIFHADPLRQLQYYVDLDGELPAETGSGRSNPGTRGAVVSVVLVVQLDVAGGQILPQQYWSEMVRTSPVA